MKVLKTNLKKHPEITSADFKFLTNLNILFNFCTSFITLKILSKKINMTVKVFLIGGCIIISDICDWSYLVQVWTIIFFLFRNSKKNRTLLFCGVSALMLLQKFMPMYDSFADFSFQLGVLPLSLILNFYNGKRKNISCRFQKTFFYAYYPLHISMILINLMKSLIHCSAASWIPDEK